MYNSNNAVMMTEKITILTKSDVRNKNIYKK